MSFSIPTSAFGLIMPLCHRPGPFWLALCNRVANALRIAENGA